MQRNLNKKKLVLIRMQLVCVDMRLENILEII